MRRQYPVLQMFENSLNKLLRKKYSCGERAGGLTIVKVIYLRLLCCKVCELQKTVVGTKIVVAEGFLCAEGLRPRILGGHTLFQNSYGLLDMI